MKNVILHFWGKIFKLFKLALLKVKRVIRFANVCMQMSYTSQMRTCIDKLSGSRTQV